MKKTEIENELRNRYFNALVKMYIDSGEDVQIIGKSVFALPVLDCEGNESWVRIKVDIPKGQRGGDVFEDMTRHTVMKSKRHRKPKKERKPPKKQSAR